MANFVFNIAKGRVAELARRVLDNDPGTSALIVVAINATATDATMRDYDTLSALLGDANVAEVTNTNYARKTIDETGDGLAAAADDTGDEYEVDFDDLTWSAVAAGDAWTDLIVCYDDNTGSGTDANLIPLTCHDFPITPDGSDITAQLAAEGFFKAS